MRKDSEHPIEIKSGSATVVPETERMPYRPRAGIVRDLGARADRIVEIDYGDGRVTHFNRGPAEDDIQLAHAIHLRDY